jgi:hypothetical protein
MKRPPENTRAEVALAWAGSAGKAVSTFVVVVNEQNEEGAPCPEGEVQVLAPRLRDGSLPATLSARIERFVSCRLHHDPPFVLAKTIAEIASPVLRTEVSALLGRKLRVPLHVLRGAFDVLYIATPQSLPGRK